MKMGAALNIFFRDTERHVVENRFQFFEETVVDVFDGNDEEAVLSARKRWKAYKDQGHTVTYWKQTESGAWVKGE